MTPNPNPSPELPARLKYYPDYIDDPDGLERFRQAVRSNAGHDMADVNYNSLGRLIDTIERLRSERDTALSPQTLPAPGEVEKAATRLRDRAAMYAATKPGQHDIATILATVAAANDEGVAEAAFRAGHRAARIRYVPAEPNGPTRFEDVDWEDAAIRLLSQGGGKAERYRHVKRGTVYELVGRASLQNANQAMLAEAACLVIYRGDDGNLWAREESEFNDGRFEPLATSRSQHEGADNA